MKPSCRIVSSDYLDRDVYLNVRSFYAAAGYRLISSAGAAADLLVVLRGDNGARDRDFSGEIHVYDYVKEYQVHWPCRYPAARSIVLVSLEEPPDDLIDPRLRWVRAYLPVIPELWACPAAQRRGRPVHLSNYKRMPGDPFQEQLLDLINSGRVEVHGARWELVGVQAEPLSYLGANRLIAASCCCYGLMWPYQRGRTLSGRMWQAPLSGCFVLSEPGTDLLACPGVIECERFDAASAALSFSSQRCLDLAREAADFWRSRTTALAGELGLDAAPVPGIARIRRLRLLLVLWDWQDRLQRLRKRLEQRIAAPRAALRSRLAGWARSMGIHPRQIRSRRREPHQ